MELGRQLLTVLTDGAPRVEVLPVAYIGNLLHQDLISFVMGPRPIKLRRAPVVGAQIANPTMEETTPWMVYTN